MKHFLVIDAKFNREWNAELIGLRFTEPPSYTAVLECDGKADFFNVEEFRSGLAKASK